MGRNPLRLVTILPILVAIGTVVGEVYGQKLLKVSTILPGLVAKDTLVVEIYFFKFLTWSWWDDVNSTCLINLIWVNSSRCTSLPYLLLLGLMKTKIPILMWIPMKRLNLTHRSAILRDFSNQGYRFTSPGHGWQKSNKSTKKKGNCKGLQVSHKGIFAFKCHETSV